MHIPAFPTHPLAYLLTFCTYGTWLPGDHRGWNSRGVRGRFAPSRDLHARCVARLAHPPVFFDREQIDVVHRSIVTTCAHRAWPIHALVVERAHGHLVVSVPQSPAQVVQYFKSWATRALRERGHYTLQPIWAAHGNARYLNSERSVERAVAYVRDPHHTPSGTTRAPGAE